MTWPVAGTVVERSFFARDATVVAPELLGKVLVAGPCAGRIAEVEAYRRDDPASHSHRGPTPRNAVMFGPAGHLYVYFTYGMHHCVNVVTGDDGDGQGVLMRAVVPLGGLDAMRQRRHGRADRELTNGPGKLGQAFALDRTHTGTDVCAGGPIAILDDGAAPPETPLVTPRIGISKAVDLPWRWVTPTSAPGV